MEPSKVPYSTNSNWLILFFGSTVMLSDSISLLVWYLIWFCKQSCTFLVSTFKPGHPTCIASYSHHSATKTHLGPKFHVRHFQARNNIPKSRATMVQVTKASNFTRTVLTGREFEPKFLFMIIQRSEWDSMGLESQIWMGRYKPLCGHTSRYLNWYQSYRSILVPRSNYFLITAKGCMELKIQSWFSCLHMTQMSQNKLFSSVYRVGRIDTI